MILVFFFFFSLSVFFNSERRPFLSQTRIKILFELNAPRFYFEQREANKGLRSLATSPRNIRFPRSVNHVYSSHSIFSVLTGLFESNFTIRIILRVKGDNHLTPPAWHTAGKGRDPLSASDK